MGHSNNGNTGDIRYRSLPLPPDVDPMGILGWQLASASERITIVTWVFFRYVLYGVDRSVFILFPVMLVEFLSF